MKTYKITYIFSYCLPNNCTAFIYANNEQEAIQKFLDKHKFQRKGNILSIERS